LEITAAGVSKASARVWLAHVRGVRACDVVAFGDSGNSIGMLRWAGMAYAMGNGTEEAKVAAVGRRVERQRWRCDCVPVHDVER